MKSKRKWISVIVIILLAIVFFFLPLPYYLEVPGQAIEIEDMVSVENRENANAEDLYMMTIGVTQVTPATSLLAIHPYNDLVSQNSLIGELENPDQYLALQQYFMESSKNTAMYVAYEAADEKVNFDANGVYVMSVVPSSTFNDLEVGDTIYQVDNVEVNHSSDLINYVSQKDIGESIDIKYTRDGEERETSGELIYLEETDSVGIGISLVDHTEITTDPQIEIDSGSVGGPSAGLMFSLQIYSELEEINLTEDYDIAGTGTIDLEGNVGRIGGIDKKVVAASEAGADYFLAPDDEIPPEYLELDSSLQSNFEKAEETAEDIGTDMEVIPVKTFNDALEFLNNL